jgi:hypothetical protein
MARPGVARKHPGMAGVAAAVGLLASANELVANELVASAMADESVGVTSAQAGASRQRVR